MTTFLQLVDLCHILTLLHREDEAYARVLPMQSSISKFRIMFDIYRALRKQERASLADVRALLDLARALENPSDKADALTKVADAFAQQGEKEGIIAILDEALEAARTIEYDQSRAIEIGHIAAALAAYGDQERSDTLLSDAATIARSIDGTSFKDAALSMIAFSFAMVGLGATGVLLLREMTYDNLKIDTLCSILEQMVDAGQTSDAIALARETGDPTYRAIALTTIADHVILRGDVQGAGKLADEALTVTEEIRSNYHKATAFSSIVKTLVYLDRTSEALTLSRGIETGYEHSKADAFISLAGTLAERGDLPEALAILQEIDTSHSSGALTSIVRALLRRGETAGALELARANASSRNAKSLYFEIASKMAERGVTVAAASLLEELLALPSEN